MVTNTDRRKFLAATGTTAAVFLAGCLGDDDDDDDETEEENDEFEIAGGETIVVDGYDTHWEGIEPSEMEGVENPTLILEDGEEYEMEWINADGGVHNLEIHDEDDNLIDDLQTEDVSEEGESASLTFTASEEMAEYICAYHPEQRADLIVE